jgi:hypothetical protein
VDGAEIGVLEQRNQVGLGCLLEGEHGLTLEPHLLLELSGDLTHQTLEGQLADEQVGLNGALITLFWNLRISRRATVPGLKRWGFLRPEGMGALLRAIFWATSCLRGTFWAVDFLAVCLVLAIK